MGSVGLSDRAEPFMTQLPKYQCLSRHLVNVVPDAISAKGKTDRIRTNCRARNWPTSQESAQILHCRRQGESEFLRYSVVIWDQPVFIEIRRSDVADQS